MDTKLRLTEPSFELQPAQIAKALMESLAIIESFNQHEALPARFIPPVPRLLCRNTTIRIIEVDEGRVLYRAWIGGFGMRNERGLSSYVFVRFGWWRIG